jgi:hypothetical protein
MDFVKGKFAPLPILFPVVINWLAKDKGRQKLWRIDFLEIAALRERAQVACEYTPELVDDWRHIVESLTGIPVAGETTELTNTMPGKIETAT